MSVKPSIITIQLPGIQGFAGASGFSGLMGATGISGISGYSGYSGFSGMTGLTGFSGYSGFSGVTGSTGISGFSGYSGVGGQVTGYTSTGNPFTIDFNAPLYQTGNITGNTTFVTVNKDAGKSVVLKLFCPTGNVLTFPAPWTWYADAPPANIGVSKSIIISLTSFSTLEGDIAATYAVSA